MTPLHASTILVTRHGAGRDELSAGLRELGAAVRVVPVMSRRRLAPDALIAAGLRAHTGPAAVIVFTSAHAVRLVAAAAEGAGVALGQVDATLVAIGPGTALVLARAGRPADIVPATFVAEAVADRLVEEGVAGRRVWLPRAAEGRPVLPERLRRAGAQVTELHLYRTRVASRRIPQLAGALIEPLDAITFTSGSTVRHFEHLRDGRPLPAGCRIACIGPVTAAAARAAGHPVDIIAAEHTVRGLLAALCAGLGVGEAAGPVVAGGPR